MTYPLETKMTWSLSRKTKLSRGIIPQKLKRNLIKRTGVRFLLREWATRQGIALLAKALEDLRKERCGKILVLIRFQLILNNPLGENKL